MAKTPRNVDETGRAITTYFAELLAAAPHGAAAGEDQEPAVEAINVRQWLHFLSHYRVLGADFNHLHALQAFYSETLEDDPERLLDSEGFKSALTKVAMALKDALSTRRMSLAAMSSQTDDLGSSQKKGAERTALDDLVADINSKREFSIDQASHELLGSLYEPEVIRAAYSYGGVLRGLYNHYAEGGAGFEPSSSSTSTVTKTTTRRMSPMLTGRSLYRLCCALRLVPMCIVPGELADVVATRCTDGRGTSTSRAAPSASERQERAAEKRYLEEDRMIDGSDDAGWMVPARGVLPGEPRYNFPELVENLVMVAFTVPPRTFDAGVEARAQRVHDIFGSALGLPSSSLPADVKAGSASLDVMDPYGVKEFLEGIFIRHGGRLAVKGGNPWDFRDILVRLSEELPQLPERREPYVPKPPPHKELPPQPETVEEHVARLQGAANEVASKKSKGGKKKKKKTGGGKKSAKGKTKLGPVEMYKVIWYAKREAPARQEQPAQSFDRRTKVLEDMHQLLLKRAEQMTAERTGMVAQLAKDPAKQAGKGSPFTERGGLRLALIDEPLRAPRCRLSEEVSTLMETALAARRLRHYEEAVALLIRARSLWAALECGRSVPPDWAEVQPLVPAPSPWGLGMVSAAVKVSLTEGGRSVTGNCNQGCRQSMPGPPERGAAIREGNAVFRRFQTSCASAHVHVRRRTGATAALAAAASAEAGEAAGAAAEGEGGDLDKTLLPSDMRPELTPVPPQSARGPSRPRPGSSGALRASASASPGATAAAAGGSFSGGSAAGTGPATAWAAPAAVVQAATPPRSASVASASMSSGSAADGERSPTAAAGRRYSPKEDFKLATGDDNADLAKLPPEAAIFFLSELASLHAAMREDELASQLLWRARAPTDRLPASHPDTAVVWCGLGRMAYLGGAPDVAARAFWRGRKIRERTLGGDTVETATSYNNLACCFFALDRPQEALVHLELAEEILRVLAGEDHPRTQTTLRNLEKARAAQKCLHAEVPNIFSYFVPEMKMRGRGKKKKGKKKGGSSKGDASSRASSAGSTTTKSSKGSKKK